MADYTIINGTEEQLVDVNAGDVDVDALSFKDGVTLDNTELAALLTTDGVAVMATAPSSQLKRVMAIASQYQSL